MKKALQIVTNKFLLTIVAFLVWMAYFDQNDWVTQQERRQDLENVNTNIAFLNKEIAQMERDFAGMKNDPKMLEKFAREQYLMKRDNEDIYIAE